jgi:D-cysteine desulfhydrase
MYRTDYLRDKFPILGEELPRMHLASLPTPVREVPFRNQSAPGKMSIKYDNLTGSVYGGNKVRKLEYIFPRAMAKQCAQIATFGAVGSNHALATALYAQRAGFGSICFLSHQAKTPRIAATLNKHIENGTELVRYGGTYARRIGTLREHLWKRKAWVIPMGGSSWLGTMGFVAAGLELASQIERHKIPLPDRLYVGTGTMGTAVGIALGLALAELPVEVHAVRVSDTSITNQHALEVLLNKTANMMRRIDRSIPEDFVARTRIIIRNEFFGPGYAQGTSATDHAIAFARDELNLVLETTYTGKAMAAILADLGQRATRHCKILYWHTYNSRPLGVPTKRPLDVQALPAEFLRYFS